MIWLRIGASGGLLRSHEILFWFHNVWGLAEEIVALKEGVFFRKLVGWFVGWLVVWLFGCVLKNKRDVSGISGCCTTTAVYG